MSKRKAQRESIQRKQEQGENVSNVKYKRVTVRAEICKVAHAKQLAKEQKQTFTSLVLSKVWSFNSNQLDIFTGEPEKIALNDYKPKSKTQLVEVLISENEAKELDKISIHYGLNISVLIRNAIDTFYPKPPQDAR